MSNGQAMVKHQSAPFEPTDLDEAKAMAEDFSKSSMVPVHLRGKPYDVYVTLVYGRELGLTPMQSVLGIWIEPGSGKPCLYEQTALALVKSSPMCKFFRLVESTNVVARFETHRHGDPAPVSMAFTIDDARQANLLGKNNWKSYPAAMLRARCAMNLARSVYEDILANVYTPEELENAVRDRAAIEVPVAPPPPKATRAPAPETVKAASVPAPTPREPAEPGWPGPTTPVADLPAAERERMGATGAPPPVRGAQDKIDAEYAKAQERAAKDAAAARALAETASLRPTPAPDPRPVQANPPPRRDDPPDDVDPNFGAAALAPVTQSKITDLERMIERLEQVQTHEGYRAEIEPIKKLAAPEQEIAKKAYYTAKARVTAALGPPYVGPAVS